MNDNSQCQTSVAEEIAKLTVARNRGVTLGDADTLRLPINNTTCRFFRVNCLTYEKTFPGRKPLKMLSPPSTTSPAALSIICGASMAELNFILAS